MPDNAPVLSIVFASYSRDRFADICELLDSISAQGYKPIETVLVVEHDRSLYEGLLQEVAGRSLSNIRLLFNPDKTGLSVNRNLGFREARGDIIAFVDDDVTLAPDWAEQVVASFSHKETIGMTGPALPMWRDQAMRWLPEEFYWLISCTSWTRWNSARMVRNVWGHNMAFRREAFDAAGLFQTKIGLHGLGGPVAEDDEFSLRVQSVTGKHILYKPEAVVWHKVSGYRLGWRYVAQRSYWMGRSRHLLTRAKAGNQDALGPEKDLLRRILTTLPWRIARMAFRSPANAGRQAWLAAWSLSFVGIGFVSGVRFTSQTD